MTTRSRLAFAFFLSVLCSLPGPSPAADPPEPEGLREVPLDLRSGALRTVLPFDTPFLLSGDPPDGVLHIEGVWCDVTDAPAESDLASLVNDRGDLDQCPTKQPPDHTSTNPRPIKGWSGDPEGDPANRKFYLFVPQRLEADHTFLFQFTLEREIQEADLARFHIETN